MEAGAEYFAPRRCLREPVPELHLCLTHLDNAALAYLAGDNSRVEAELRAADSEAAHDWIDSMWGKSTKWPQQVHYKRLRKVADLHRRTGEKDGKIPKTVRVEAIRRDGFVCRYCSLPVVPQEVREYLRKEFPEAARWGNKNNEQHRGFQALWLQFDHVLPASMGGFATIDNIVVSCAGCNYCKEGYHLQELGLLDPRHRAPVASGWDGLTRILPNGLRTYK